MLNHVSIIHILEMIEPQNRRNLERDSWNVPWDPCICNFILLSHYNLAFIFHGQNKFNQCRCTGEFGAQGRFVAVISKPRLPG